MHPGLITLIDVKHVIRLTNYIDVAVATWLNIVQNIVSDRIGHNINYYVRLHLTLILIN